MPVFPSVVVLDSYKRGNENPLSNGGKWTKLQWAKLIGLVASEAWAPADAFPDVDGAFWNVLQYADPGVSLLVAKRPENIERFLVLWCCLKAPAAEKTGYCVRVLEEAGGKKATFTVEKWVAGVKTTLATVTKVVYDVGDSFAISVQSGKVIAWRKLAAGAWGVIAEPADAAYTKGYVGMEGGGNLSRVQNFSAGTAIHEHTLTVAQGQSPQRQAAVTRALALTQAQTVSRIVAVARTLPTVGQQQVADQRQIARTLTLTQGQTVSRTAALARSLSTTVATLATVATHTTRAVATGQPTTVVVNYALNRLLVVGQETIPTIENDRHAAIRLLATDTSSTPSATLNSTTEVRPLAEDEPALLIESTAV